MTVTLTARDRQASGDERVTCNDDQELFVTRQGDGYGTLGYRNCHEENVALAKALGRPDLVPGEETYGTLASYELRDHLLGAAAGKDLGTWFAPRTVPEVRQVLERLRGSTNRVRITYGDTETGRAWGDRPETGTIGRTGGILKSPILVATVRSHGGGIISTAAIVRIEQDGRDLYRHPKFHHAPPEPADEPAALPAPGIDPLGDLSREPEAVTVPRF